MCQKWKTIKNLTLQFFHQQKRLKFLPKSETGAGKHETPRTSTVLKKKKGHQSAQRQGHQPSTALYQSHCCSGKDQPSWHIAHIECFCMSILTATSWHTTKRRRPVCVWPAESEPHCHTTGRRSGRSDSEGVFPGSWTYYWKHSSMVMHVTHSQQQHGIFAETGLVYKYLFSSDLNIYYLNTHWHWAITL